MPDTTFDDWFAARLDFNRATAHMGTTYGTGQDVATGASFDELNPPEEFDSADFEDISGGPMDVEAPSVEITAPADGTTFNQGDNVAVDVTATDDVSLDRVEVLFDLDGSGAIDQPGETATANPTGGNQFQAVFANVGGPDGPRDITAEAHDTSESISQDVVPIDVPEPSGVGMLLAGVALVSALRRWRRRQQVK